MREKRRDSQSEVIDYVTPIDRPERVRAVEPILKVSNISYILVRQALFSNDTVKG